MENKEGVFVFKKKRFSPEVVFQPRHWWRGNREGSWRVMASVHRSAEAKGLVVASRNSPASVSCGISHLRPEKENSNRGEEKKSDCRRRTAQRNT